MPARKSEPPVSGTADLLALIERLERLLESSGLAELEIEAGGTALVLRTAAAVAPAAASAEQDSSAPAAEQQVAPAAASVQEPGTSAVLAPLTGLFYGSPSPGAEPYVHVGAEVVVGQVIGLIEAMKLFNEIKSDVAGRVVRIHAENGALVKAKDPLIEVAPS
jgi:acetyl-CoA carboxylase biotin carboxyl carrier protein